MTRPSLALVAVAATACLPVAREGVAPLHLEVAEPDDALPLEISAWWIEIAAIRFAEAAPAGVARHPGHGEETGFVRGERLGPVTIDLRTPGRVPLGDLRLIAGRVQRLELSLAETGEVAVLRGDLPSADTADDAAVDFSLSAPALPIRVDAPGDLWPDSAVTLHFDPARALEGLDLSHPDANGDGVRTTADAPYDRAFPFLIRSAAPWSVAYAPVGDAP